MIANPPACLVDYILLKDGCYCEDGVKVPTPSPKSGYYIESLPGLSLENISDITPENQTTTELVNNMVYFAANIVEKQITGYLSGQGFDLNKRGTIQTYCSVSSKVSTPVSLKKGIRISRAGIKSSQARLYIESLKVKSQTTGTTTIEVLDLDDNVLYTKTVTLNANVETTVPIQAEFKEEVIFLVVNASTVTLYEYNCQGQGGCCGKNIRSSDISVIGWDGVQPSYIGFVGACISLNCTDFEIICNWIDRLKLAILYRAGALLLQEWIAPSSRINFIKNSKEWAEATIPIWENQSIDFVKAELRNIENIVKYDKYCFYCENNFRTIAVLPS